MPQFYVTVTLGIEADDAEEANDIVEDLIAPNVDYYTISVKEIEED